jgi:hypothetical protein
MPSATLVINSSPKKAKEDTFSSSVALTSILMSVVAKMLKTKKLLNVPFNKKRSRLSLSAMPPSRSLKLNMKTTLKVKLLTTDSTGFLTLGMITNLQEASLPKVVPEENRLLAAVERKPTIRASLVLPPLNQPRVASLTRMKLTNSLMRKKWLSLNLASFYSPRVLKLKNLRPNTFWLLTLTPKLKVKCLLFNLKRTTNQRKTSFATVTTVFVTD